jgi:predicted RNA polymerase sigma factor
LRATGSLILFSFQRQTGQLERAHHTVCAIAHGLAPRLARKVFSAVLDVATDLNAGDAEKIVSLYDTLISIRPSPIVALNRAIAVGQRDGPEDGAQALRGSESSSCSPVRID